MVWIDKEGHMRTGSPPEVKEPEPALAIKPPDPIRATFLLGMTKDKAVWSFPQTLQVEGNSIVAVDATGKKRTLLTANGTCRVGKTIVPRVWRKFANIQKTFPGLKILED